MKHIFFSLFFLLIIPGLGCGPCYAKDMKIMEELEAAAPRGKKINSLFILDNGRVFMDFDQNIKTLRDYSAQSEMLAIFSIADALILNIEKIKRVKILIPGETAQMLWGHIDLDCFYEANMLIVK